MKIGEIDLPDPLLDAQARGELVVFAGAGVSVAPPSSYPQLRELAIRVASETSMKPREGEPLDRFLGRLGDEGVNVHEKISDLLTDPESRPSPLHHDLLKLFPSAREVRLVTTNFDTHFEAAAAEVFDEPVTVYRAPALPLGYRVEGLIYLHGTVDPDPSRIVLTDGDFGRAYLTEGWARRFLQELFLTYTVLFVGYSHNDPVMNYLARGLPPQAGRKITTVRRYALTPNRSHGHWEFLGIEPITYPLVDGENPHRALADSVSEWAAISRMEQGEHERRIRELVRNGPPADETGEDYLRRALHNSATLPVFTRHATGPEWMEWVERQGVFDPLTRVGSVDETSVEIARWFVSRFAVQHADEALMLVRRHGGTLNPVLWDELVKRFSSPREKRPEPASLARWVAILLHPAQQAKSPEELVDLLWNCDRPGDETSALLLFEYLTRPYLSLGQGEKGRGMGKRFRTELRLQGDHGRLREAWERLFQPRLDDLTEWLRPILSAQLAQARLLLTTMAETRRQSSPALRFLQEAHRNLERASQRQKAA